MDFKEFRKLSVNPDAYSVADVSELELLSDEELQRYQTEIEKYGGDNLSDWDHLRAFLTLKKRWLDLREARKNNKSNSVKIRPLGKRTIIGEYLGYKSIVDPDQIVMITVANPHRYTIHLRGGYETTIEGNAEELIKELDWDVVSINDNNKIEFKREEGDKR